MWVILIISRKNTTRNKNAENVWLAVVKSISFCSSNSWWIPCKKPAAKERNMSHSAKERNMSVWVIAYRRQCVANKMKYTRTFKRYSKANQANSENIKEDNVAVGSENTSIPWMVQVIGFALAWEWVKWKAGNISIKHVLTKHGGNDRKARSRSGRLGWESLSRFP